MAEAETVVACGVTNALETGVRGICSTSAWDGAKPSELAGAINWQVSAVNNSEVTVSQKLDKFPGL